MKLVQFMNSKVGMVTAIGVVGGVALYMAEKKARGAAGAVGEAFTPTSHNNIFAKGVDGLGASLTGDENFRLGGWIYDLFHDDPTAR